MTSSCSASKRSRFPLTFPYPSYGTHNHLFLRLRRRLAAPINIMTRNLKIDRGTGVDRSAPLHLLSPLVPLIQAIERVQFSVPCPAFKVQRVCVVFITRNVRIHPFCIINSNRPHQFCPAHAYALQFNVAIFSRSIQRISQQVRQPLPLFAF